jgi:hypothetical protein
LSCGRDLQLEIHDTEAKMGKHECKHESCQNHLAYQSYKIGGSTDAFHPEKDPRNDFCGTGLPTDSLDLTSVVSMVVLGETEDELSRLSITSISLECEPNSELSGDESDVSSSLASTSPGRRVSFLPFAQIMDIPKIDLRDVHLCFYSQEDIAEFRHSKWVEEHGFDPDSLHESGAGETPMGICFKTDYSTRRVSFSDKVETFWIPRIQESEWDLCFYNSDDIDELRHEVLVESGGLFKAFSSCWKERERDDEEMTDSTHSVSQSSFEDDDLQVVMLEDSFNEGSHNGDYQASSCSSSSRVSFSDDIQVKHFPKVGPSEWGDCYYDADELADFRHEAWVEQCARHAM